MARTRLQDMIGVLEDVAPLELAEDWDNVGLLLEPKAKATVRRALLTIDLTPAVFLRAAALAFVIALLTVSYQAIKAALADPVEALRYE